MGAPAVQQSPGSWVWLSSESSTDGGARRSEGEQHGNLAETLLSSLSKPATRPSSKLGRALPLSLWAKQASSEQLRGTGYSLPSSRELALSRPAKSQRRHGSLSIMGKETGRDLGRGQVCPA